MVTTSEIVIVGLVFLMVNAVSYFVISQKDDIAEFITIALPIIGVTLSLLALSYSTTTSTSDSTTGASDASTYQTTGGAARFTYYDSEGTEYLFQENQMMIVQDNQTGVRYLVVRDKNGDMSGMTALLDTDGTVDLDPEVGE